MCERWPPNACVMCAFVGRRGLAEYPKGSSLPLPLNTIRQMFGKGVRAGMYPITEQQAYWYICFNASEVRLQQHADGRASLARRRLVCRQGPLPGSQQAMAG